MILRTVFQGLELSPVFQHLLLGGGNPWHPDSTEYLLHDFRCVAQTNAPPGLQLEACVADNCLFSAISVAHVRGQPLQASHVHDFRAQCVNHLRATTPLSEGYLQEMSRPGVWGDEHILRAAAHITNSSICGFLPGTLPFLCSALPMLLPVCFS